MKMEPYSTQYLTLSILPKNANYTIRWTSGNERIATVLGTGGTLFSPNMQVTRGQAVAFLWRAAGRPTPTLKENPFKDVKQGDYYYEAVLWAVQQGIAAGTSATTFAPNATLNYDQLLAFLCRANGGYSGGTEWSALAVIWAQSHGLLDGLPGTFKAGAACPRSDVVYFLWKNYLG